MLDREARVDALPARHAVVEVGQRLGRPRGRGRRIQPQRQAGGEPRALDLEPDVFKKRSASDVARSLKRSAERSKARKSDPYRSAMSMLSFYINRAGAKLSASRKRTLNEAKQELRKLYGRGVGE